MFEILVWGICEKPLDQGGGVGPGYASRVGRGNGFLL